MGFERLACATCILTPPPTIEPLKRVHDEKRRGVGQPLAQLKRTVPLEWVGPVALQLINDVCKVLIHEHVQCAICQSQTA
jgi:hypothetical protein